MKRLMNLFAIAITGFFLSTQTGLAQHSEHQKGEATDTTKTATGQMMPMQQQMTSGSMARRGMMKGTNKGSKNMMGGKGMMQGGMHGKGMMQGGMMGMNDPVIQALHSSGCPGFLLMSANDLELTDAQKEKLETLKLDWKKTSVKINADIAVSKIEIKEALVASSPDFADVKAKAKKIGAAEQELRTSFINTVIQARTILTPEQLAKVKDLAGTCCNGKMGMGMNK